MKITYLSNTSVPSNVASSIQIMKMCEAFSSLGNNVSLITTNTSKIKSNLFEFYNIKNKFNIFKIKYFKKFPLGLKYYLFSFVSILEGIKLNTDIYITRNYFTCFILTLLKKKVIMELHHDLNEESRIVRFIFKVTRYLNSKNVILIVAITNALKVHYSNKYKIKKEKILVLASGSSLEKNFNFSFNKKYFKIGYFGSIYKSRGYEMIINLAKIDRKNRYYLYGNLKNINNANYKNKTRNLYLQNHIAYKDIPKNLSKMDLLILPYVSAITVAGDVGDITKYTSPLKLFDYLTAGKVILCSDYKVLKEAINQNNAIFVKNFKNIYSWRNEIIKLSNQPQRRFIISRNNYNLSRSFTLKERAKKILKEININRCI
tara:strand:+ start:8099 stop:9220 length:1122 start_codon:yes stop_codon:yes gene_type:complete